MADKALIDAFGHVPQKGRTPDVFFAGDDEQAKACVSELIESPDYARWTSAD